MECRPDKLLVELAARGDGESFTELCRRHYGPLVAIGHAILGDRHLAEDAAQEVLAKVAVHLPELRRADQFGCWVAAICRNEARDLDRARRRPQTTDETATEKAPTGGYEIGEAVTAALSQLPSAARAVIYLRFYDGLSYDQISAVLGISEQAHRQLTPLGEKLDPDDPVTTMADALMPALLKVLTIKTVQQAHAHATRAAVDICLYRATTGRLPATLPPGLPKDPFSGRDFQYERTASGFVLRCQGKDLDKDTIHEFEFTIRSRQRGWSHEAGSRRGPAFLLGGLFVGNRPIDACCGWRYPSSPRSAGVGEDRFG